MTRKTSLFLLSLVLLSRLPFSIHAQDPAFEYELKLVFTGDIMGHDSQIAAARQSGEALFSYRDCFRYLDGYWQSAGLLVGNLEVTLAGEPYKGYPAFSSPDALADALKESGFDILVSANNHALDRGKRGLERTVRVLREKGLVQTGTFVSGKDRELRYPLIVEKNGIRIAFLNYTYGTNGIRDRPPVIVNRIDSAQIKLDLQKARDTRPDLVLVLMHWGTEYQLQENRQQRELANFLFRHGAHAIIGSHPHVVQPIKGKNKGNLVVYSLGNMISNQRTPPRDGGIAFEMDIVKKVHPGQESSCDIRDFGYLPFWVWKPQTKKGTRFMLVPANMSPLQMDQLGMKGPDREKMDAFLKDTRSRLNGTREVRLEELTFLPPR